MTSRLRWAALAAILAVVLAILLSSILSPGPTADSSANPSIIPSSNPASPTPPAVGWFEPAPLDSALAATWGTVAIDRDFDGQIDLFMGKHRDPPQLFSGDPRRLQLEGVSWPHPMDRHGCAWGEANGDGLPDLLCVQGAARARANRPNELWIQRPDGTLHNEASRYGVELPPQRSRSVNWIDYDRDGDLDLFVGAYRRENAPDVLLRNDRGSFSQVDVGLTAELNVISSTWADVDRDGWPDLLVVQSNGPTVLYRNRQGRFRLTHPQPIGRISWLSASWGDADLDGWPDLALVRADHVLLLRNDRGVLRRWLTVDTHRTRAVAWADLNADGRNDLYVVQGAPGFEPGPDGDQADVVLLRRSTRGFASFSLTETAGWAGAGESVAASDLDQDGRPDVIVANGNHRWSGLHHVLLNQMPAGNAVLFGLRGPRWNPLGFGARIEVGAGGRHWTINLSDGVSGSVQAAGQVLAGIGTASRARVVIEWADGQRDCIVGLAGDFGLVRAGSSPCRDR